MAKCSTVRYIFFFRFSSHFFLIHFTLCLCDWSEYLLFRFVRDRHEWTANFLSWSSNFMSRRSIYRCIFSSTFNRTIHAAMILVIDKKCIAENKAIDKRRHKNEYKLWIDGHKEGTKKKKKCEKRNRNKNLIRLMVETETAVRCN